MSDEPRIWTGEESRTHGEVQGRAARLATGLRAAGVGAGDRIALLMRNETAFLEVTLAAGRIGAVPVPLNWHWTGDDLAHALENSRSRLAVVHGDLLPVVAAQAPDLSIIEAVEPDAVRAAYRLPTRPPTRRVPTLEDLIGANEPWTEQAPPAPMAVIYTSGTTGSAKGVLRDPIPPRDRPTALANVASLFHLREGATTLVPAPLYHSAPNAHAVFSLAMGMDVHVMPRFDAEGFLRLVEQHRVTTVQMVPTMFVRLLQLPEPVRRSYDLSSLTAIVHAAAPCPPQVKAAMIDWLGPIVHEYYGGAEIGAFTACDSTEALTRPGTVGRPVLDADVRILDEHGTELPTGEDGIVYGRPFSGWPDFTYIDDDAKRRGMEQEGYLTLGDIGHLDVDGYLYLADRQNDMVISGGVNIYPAEIEACLHDLDGVADVAVFGIPDSDMGEAIAAHVQPLPGATLAAEDIRDHVSSRLARYKVPREVVLVEELPREDTGKIFKRLLKEKYLSPDRPLTDRSST
ncbi:MULTISPECIES: AMP-binding protein [Pseudonocardia]|uniref:Long-chain-fatty-acid--CoA ligase FadD13 n=2 Tax=Pseudonocardia TaxID=1847 RepID=A0A1Y2MP16_PSEAH|nr:MULTISPECIES: AMP-binding protein [Pseudonocardia]OSY36986.1 Long-chain-fatty-acid--CoA ligase FadD13 [Pseudonocardia autotrophica]TDN75669.1 long-chain acyl-CoA synthetase [Pseudonocardia autotrophica]BBF99641.1 acyl-CoA synthetase [Pseudonocardia autotrophica]GEC27703.1 acyl-CoA synthetase [Pseudonocardia saturnea]